MTRTAYIFLLICLLAAAGRLQAAPDLNPFLTKYCTDCHDADTKKGDLDLTSFKLDLEDQQNFSRWVLIHDRVASGEMPPRKKARPEPADLSAFTSNLSTALAAADSHRAQVEGRATQRRLNRYEYENA